MPAAALIVNTTTIVGSGSTLVCNKPTNTAQGDMLLAWQGDDDGQLSSISPPSGWTTLTSVDMGINATHFKLYYKLAGSSEGSTYTFNQNVGTDGVLTTMALRNVDTNAAHWLYAAGATANSTSRVCSSLTRVPGGGVLLCSAMADMNNTAVTITQPTGMAKQSGIQSSTWTAMSVATLLCPPDPSATRTFTLSSSTQFGTGLGIQSSLFIPAAVNEGQFFCVLAP